MKTLKKFGRPLAVILMAAGVLLMLYAWFVSPKAYSAVIRIKNSPNGLRVAVQDSIAANWLQSAGVKLFPGDSILYSGVKIDPNFKLPVKQDQVLVYEPAYPILAHGDRTSVPLDTPIIAPLQVEIANGVPLTVQVGDKQFAIASAATTVGEALAQAGVSLQGMDASVPAEDQPLPSDGVIQVKRIRETVDLEESPVAFAVARVADPNMTVGTEEVRQTGENGVQVSSVRVRYENDKEVSRVVEQTWISKPPVDQITAYGGKVVVQTSSANDCFVDYWLAKEVYVTSYHDTGQTTASGIWPTYGMAAVSPEWYKILKGSSICVPGYGVATVTDVCPGCSGKAWVDVFLPTADYISWSKNLTVYFMTPVPAGFTGDLP